MAIIENVGSVRDMDAFLDSLSRFLPDNKYMSEFEIEELFKECDVVKLYDDNGHLTEDETQAVFKIIELKDMFKKSNNVQLCVSLVKSQAKVERWGHISDEVWLGMFVGSEDKLYSKWISQKDVRDLQRANYIAQKASSLNIGGMLEGTETDKKLNEMTERIKINPPDVIENKTLKAPSDYTNFLDEVYDLLYMKESWRDSEGKLSRLYSYFNSLGLKILQDPNNSKYMKFSKRRERVMFNSRLLNNYGDYIIITANHNQREFTNYKVVRSVEGATALGFEEPHIDIAPISFFRTLDEVVFNGGIDDFEFQNLHRLYHVIEERKERLPKEMQTMGSLDINLRIKGSVDMALRIAQTDYKFIVPMYCFEKGGIQFLLPLYNSFDSNSKPECALVVDRNERNKWEIRTVLELETAYRNARLINRPDQNWLSIDERL